MHSCLDAQRTSNPKKNKAYPPKTGKFSTHNLVGTVRVDLISISREENTDKRVVNHHFFCPSPPPPPPPLPLTQCCLEGPTITLRRGRNLFPVLAWLSFYGFGNTHNTFLNSFAHCCQYKFLVESKFAPRNAVQILKTCQIK